MTAALALGRVETVPPGIPWTPAEDAILRANYQKLGAQQTAVLLNRSLCSTHHRAQRLKVFTHARWTASDDKRLTMLWGDIGLAAIAKTLNRTQDACYFRANKIGLVRGLQPGMEYVRNAAHRVGFAPQTLEAIFKWYGIKPQRTMSRPTEGASYRWHSVDPEDVDEAVAAWMAAETIHDAATRRGISDQTLIRLLLASGFKLPARQKGRHPWRIPTEIVDRAVAEKEAREGLADAAKRVGLSRGTLARLLEAAGVKRWIGKCWFVDKATVDRVVAEAVRIRPKIQRAIEGRRAA